MKPMGVMEILSLVFLVILNFKQILVQGQRSSQSTSTGTQSAEKTPGHEFFTPLFDFSGIPNDHPINIDIALNDWASQNQDVFSVGSSFGGVHEASLNANGVPIVNRVATNRRSISDSSSSSIRTLSSPKSPITNPTFVRKGEPVNRNINPNGVLSRGPDSEAPFFNGLKPILSALDGILHTGNGEGTTDNGKVQDSGGRLRQSIRPHRLQNSSPGSRGGFINVNGNELIESSLQDLNAKIDSLQTSIMGDVISDQRRGSPISHLNNVRQKDFNIERPISDTGNEVLKTDPTSSSEINNNVMDVTQQTDLADHSTTMVEPVNFNFDDIDIAFVPDDTQPSGRIPFIRNIDELLSAIPEDGNKHVIITLDSNFQVASIKKTNEVPTTPPPKTGASPLQLTEDNANQRDSQTIRPSPTTISNNNRRNSFIAEQGHDNVNSKLLQVSDIGNAVETNPHAQIPLSSKTPTIKDSVLQPITNKNENPERMLPQTNGEMQDNAFNTRRQSKTVLKDILHHVSLLGKDTIASTITDEQLAETAKTLATNAVNAIRDRAVRLKKLTDLTPVDLSGSNSKVYPIHFDEVDIKQISNPFENIGPSLSDVFGSNDMLSDPSQQTPLSIFQNPKQSNRNKNVNERISKVNNNINVVKGRESNTVSALTDKKIESKSNQNKALSSAKNDISNVNVNNGSPLDQTSIPRDDRTKISTLDQNILSNSNQNDAIQDQKRKPFPDKSRSIVDETSILPTSESNPLPDQSAVSAIDRHIPFVNQNIMSIPGENNQNTFSPGNQGSPFLDRKVIPSESNPPDESFNLPPGLADPFLGRTHPLSDPRIASSLIENNLNGQNTEVISNRKKKLPSDQNNFSPAENQNNLATIIGDPKIGRTEFKSNIDLNIPPDAIKKTKALETILSSRARSLDRSRGMPVPFSDNMLTDGLDLSSASLNMQGQDGHPNALSDLSPGPEDVVFDFSSHSDFMNFLTRMNGGRPVRDEQIQVASDVANGLLLFPDEAGTEKPVHLSDALPQSLPPIAETAGSTTTRDAITPSITEGNPKDQHAQRGQNSGSPTESVFQKIQHQRVTTNKQPPANNNFNILETIEKINRNRHEQKSLHTSPKDLLSANLDNSVHTDNISPLERNTNTPERSPSRPGTTGRNSHTSKERTPASKGRNNEETNRQVSNDVPQSINPVKNNQGKSNDAEHGTSPQSKNPSQASITNHRPSRQPPKKQQNSKPTGSPRGRTPPGPQSNRQRPQQDRIPFHLWFKPSDVIVEFDSKRGLRRTRIRQGARRLPFPRSRHPNRNHRQPPTGPEPSKQSPSKDTNRHPRQPSTESESSSQLPSKDTNRHPRQPSTGPGLSRSPARTPQQNINTRPGQAPTRHTNRPFSSRPLHLRDRPLGSRSPINPIQDLSDLNNRPSVRPQISNTNRNQVPLPHSRRNGRDPGIKNDTPIPTTPGIISERPVPGRSDSPRPPRRNTSPPLSVRDNTPREGLNRPSASAATNGVPFVDVFGQDSGPQNPSQNINPRIDSETNEVLQKPNDPFSDLLNPNWDPVANFAKPGTVDSQNVPQIQQSPTEGSQRSAISQPRGQSQGGRRGPSVDSLQAAEVSPGKQNPIQASPTNTAPKSEEPTWHWISSQLQDFWDKI